MKILNRWLSILAVYAPRLIPRVIARLFVIPPHDYVTVDAMREVIELSVWDGYFDNVVKLADPGPWAIYLHRCSSQAVPASLLQLHLGELQPVSMRHRTGTVFVFD